MGIYLRYAAALIILATFSDSYASVRKNVSMPSKQSVIEGAGASFQTPNGEAAFYGKDFVDEHSAGNRFKPGDSPGSAKQKITLKPSLTANPASVAKAAIKSLRGGIPGAVAGAAMQGILATADAVMDPDNTTIKIPSISEPSTRPGDYIWYYPPSVQPSFASPSLACKGLIASKYSNSPYKYDRYTIDTPTSVTCYASYESSGSYQIGPVYRSGTGCSGTYNSTTGECLVSDGTFRDATDSDFDMMEKWASAQNSDFVRDLIKETCANSPSPAACIDQMTQWGKLSGPSSATGTPQTTTSVTTNPDGTTSTTATTTQNKYNYNYGDNYYNYSTTTTTTTKKDGQITTTETSDGIPTDEPTSEENPNDEDESYTFNDSQMPEVPSFYEQKYPDGLSGVWDNASSQVNNSQFIQFLNGFVPSFSGSCPSFGLSFNIASWASYGSIGFSSLCYVFDFIKVILLVTALFTFRAITFGG